MRGEQSEVVSSKYWPSAVFTYALVCTVVASGGWWMVDGVYSEHTPQTYYSADVSALEPFNHREEMLSK